MPPIFRRHSRKRKEEISRKVLKQVIKSVKIEEVAIFLKHDFSTTRLKESFFLEWLSSQFEARDQSISWFYVIDFRKIFLWSFESSASIRRSRKKAFFSSKFFRRSKEETKILDDWDCLLSIVSLVFQPWEEFQEQIGLHFLKAFILNQSIF